MIKKILAAWLIGLLCLSAALAEEAPGNPMLSPGEDVARERVAVVLMRAFELGLLK